MSKGVLSKSGHRMVRTSLNTGASPRLGVVVAEFVVAAARVLDERATFDNDAWRAVAFQHNSACWASLRLESFALKVPSYWRVRVSRASRS